MLSFSEELSAFCVSWDLNRKFSENKPRPLTFDNTIRELLEISETRKENQKQAITLSFAFTNFAESLDILTTISSIIFYNFDMIDEDISQIYLELMIKIGLMEQELQECFQEVHPFVMNDMIKHITRQQNEYDVSKEDWEKIDKINKIFPVITVAEFNKSLTIKDSADIMSMIVLASDGFMRII